ncbi:MAG TPA: hypothetical protein VFQ65_15200 [Kofleriaceae bacterium]|nr:hypothetical protein [Kofleriaceae bacterium]
MRSAVLIVVAGFWMSAGCKGKPKHRPPPQNLGTVDPNSKPTKSTGGEAPDIDLPHGTGKPPVKTTEPLPLKKLLELQGRTWNGFKNEPHAINPDKGMEVQHVTNDKPKITATITIAPCSEQSVLGPCKPMQLPLWQADVAHLKMMIPDELRAGAKFEIGLVKFHATDLIYTFQIGQTNGTFSKGSNAGMAYVAFTYSYILYFNDGVNQIRVVAEYKDAPMATVEDMQKLVAREDLENTAKGFFDAFTALW